MDDPNMHAYGEDGPTDAEIGRQWRENSSLEKWFPITAERLAALEAKNAALAREAHTWWTACRDATGEIERLRGVLLKIEAGEYLHLPTMVRDALGPNAKLTCPPRAWAERTR